ncbi:acyl-CoA dehydrogenase [Deltaproteobacteria bacterium TL4]
MATKYLSKRNIQFLLYEVFDVVSLTQHAYYQQHSQEVFDMILDSSLQLANTHLFPILKEMDLNPPELVNQEVHVHPAVKTIMRECGKGGWISSSFSEEEGGAQLPLTISNLCRFIFAAANYSGSVFADLTAGAAHLILACGTEEQKQRYVPKMISGEWQGTMALTEPDAGSSLADLTTVAKATNAGHYLIRGQKIFTSAGDHNGTDNVIHLMLARIEGAPSGTRGISLFVVPKKRLGPHNKLESNDIYPSQVFHKLGYKGAPLLQLSIGDNNDCHGYLLGEPQHGLKYMFQMMNEARLEVGMGATGIATAAYYASLEYTRERTQGRPVTQKDPNVPQIPIIEHTDVKRMLLFQRSIIEGSLSLLTQCCLYYDLEKSLAGEEREKYNHLLQILTPVAKTFPSEMGILSVSQGLQCLGGYGFCDDFPLEQYYRDIRIHPIHEGTTGIQGMDLLGRKVTMNNGKAVMFLGQEIQKTIDSSQTISELKPYAEQLTQAVEKLSEVTMHLISKGQNPEVFLADSTLYLEFFGMVIISWQWLLQAVSAQEALTRTESESEQNFYQGKLFTFRYYFSYELPKIAGLATRLMDNDPITVNMKTEYFAD